MNAKNEYLEKYKSLSNADLLNINDNPNDYRPEAFQAAEEELERRKMTDSEIDEARQLISSVKMLRLQKQQKTEEKVQRAYNSIFSNNKYFDENGKIIMSADKLIRVISIAMGILFLISIYQNFSLFSYSYSDFKTDGLIATLCIWIPFIGLPVGIIFFILRKRIGWYLLSLYLGYMIMSSILSQIIILFYFRSFFPELNLVGSHYGKTFFAIALYGIILFYLSTASIKGIFHVSRKQMKLTFAIIAIVSLLLYWKLIF